MAPVINRKDWDPNTFLVGHEGAIEVALFNPNIYKYKEDSGAETDICVCAIGSQGIFN